MIPWGEIFAYCHPPRQPLPATGCGHVFQVLSAVTLMGGRDHILSPSYLWAVYLTAVLLTRALCTSCIKTYITNKKMVKSCAAIGCKKRHGSGESFHRFPSSKFRQKQWLASMQLLNPPVLKYAYVCSDHFTDEDYVRNHTLQSWLLQSTVNKVLKRDAFLEGLGTCEIGVHNLSHFFKKRNSHNWYTFYHAPCDSYCI